MVYRGHIENGNVVIDEPAGLTDGTQVEVRVLAQQTAFEESPRRHWLEFSGAIDDLPPDASQRVDEILYGRPQSFNNGWDLYRARTDKHRSLTDCISLDVMRERGLSEALSSDRHFEQAGFRILLR